MSDSAIPMDCSPPGSSVHGDSPGKNSGVGYHTLLQGILPTQGWEPGLLHCRQILYHLSHQGSPVIIIGNVIKCLVYPKPLQYFGLENPMDYPWGCKESDMAEQLSLSHNAPSLFHPILITLRGKKLVSLLFLCYRGRYRGIER